MARRLDSRFRRPQCVEKRSKWKHDAKYQKVRATIELCDKYEAELHMKVAMDHPLRLGVLEQTTSLNATWVVFDRHHGRNQSFYARRMPCNVVMMNNEGEADVVKVRPMMIDEGTELVTPGTSPAVASINFQGYHLGKSDEAFKEEG